MKMDYDFDHRPITIVGAGTLGRRMALVLSTRGSEVRIFDKNQKAGDDAVKYIAERLPRVLSRVPGGTPAKVVAADDLSKAVADAWIVFEVVPEHLELKKELFGELDSLSPGDAILASNSSSYPASQFIDRVKRPERVLNTHFFMPPDNLAVELMSCGKTDPAVIDLLMTRFPLYGLAPFRVLKESVGLIFNRIWAAIKRESLAVVAEGVSTPADVDRIWTVCVGTKSGPFRAMDYVGLDVVLDIEEHYAGIREGIPEGPRKLLRSYLDKGWKGRKSGRGFYDDYPLR